MKWVSVKDKKPPEKEGTEIIVYWFTGFCQNYTNFYRTENVVRLLSWHKKFGWIDAAGSSYKDFDGWREIKPMKIIVKEK